MRKIVYLMFVVITLVSCASVPTSQMGFDRTKDYVESDKIPEQAGVLYFYRPYNFVGSAVSPTIEIESEKRFSIDMNGFTSYLI